MGDLIRLTTEATLRSGDSATCAAPDLDSAPAVRQLREGLMHLLARQVRDPAVAEDICNEAFHILFERLHRRPLDEPSKLAAYLAQTARNLLVTHYRKDARRQTSTGQQSAIDRYPDADADPSTDAQSRSRARAIREVLREMPSLRDRQILVRYYLNEEPKAAICHDLGLTAENFDIVVHRARNRFRVLLARRFAPSDLLGLVLA